MVEALVICIVVIVLMSAMWNFMVINRNDDIALLTEERADLIKARDEAQGKEATLTHRLNEKTAEAEAQRKRADALGDRPTSQTLQKAKEECAEMEESRDWWKEHAENALKASTQHKAERDEARENATELKAKNTKLGNQIGGYKRASQEKQEKIDRLEKKITWLTADRKQLSKELEKVRKIVQQHNSKEE